MLNIGTLTGTLNLEDNFSKGLDLAEGKVGIFSREVSGLSLALGGLGIAAGAVTALTTATIALGTRGAMVADVRSSFVSLAGSIENADRILQAMRGGVVNTVSDLELMKLTNKTLGSGLVKTAEDFGTLAEGSRLLAKRTGTDTVAAFELLTNAMASGRTASLKQLGIFVDAKVATEEYAKSIGKSSGDLTQMEKATALSTQALKQLRGEIAAGGVDAADFGEKIDQAKTFVANFTDNLAMAVANSDVLKIAMGTAGEALTKAFGSDTQSQINSLVGIINSFAIKMVDVAQFSIEAARGIGNAFFGLRAAFFTVLGWLTDMSDKFLSLQISVAEGLKWVMPDAPLQHGIDKLKEIKTMNEGVGASFKQTSEEAMNSAAGMNTSLDNVQKTLGTMRAEMVKAAAGQGEHKAAIDAANGSIRQQTTETAALTKEQEKEVAALKSLVEQLSGKQIFTEAERIAKAIGNIENVNKLTRTELEQLMGTLDKAIAKYNAMGVQAPPQVMNVAIAINALLEKMQDAATGAKLLGDNIQKALTPPPLANLFDPMKFIEPLKKGVQSSLGPSLFGDIGKGMQGALGQLPGVVMSALTGGGKVSDAIGGLFGSQLGGAISKHAAGALSSIFGKTLGGALNTMLPGIGAMLGPLISKGLGALAGGIKKLFGGVSEEVKKARTELEAFKDKLIGGLSAQQKAEANGDRFAGTMIAVRDAVLKTGGTAAEAERLVAQLLNTDKPEQMRAAMGRVNEIFAKQQQLIEEEKQKIEDLKQAMFDAGAKGELISADMAKLRDKLKGTAEIDEFIKGQTRSAADHVKNFLDNAKITTQVGASAMAGVVLAAWDGTMQGMRDLMPHIQALQKGLEAAGFQGGAAFGELQHLAAIASDTILGPMLTGINEMTGAMTNMFNAGLLTDDMFQGLVGEVMNLRAGMIAEGQSAGIVNRAMQRDLQQIWTLVNRHGFAVDETTAKILEEGEAQGIIGERFLSSTDKMVAGIERMVEIFEHVFGDRLPNAAAEGSSDALIFLDRVDDRLRGLPRDIILNIRGELDMPEIPGGTTTGTGGTQPSGEGMSGSTALTGTSSLVTNSSSSMSVIAPVIVRSEADVMRTVGAWNQQFPDAFAANVNGMREAVVDIVKEHLSGS